MDTSNKIERELSLSLDKFKRQMEKGVEIRTRTNKNIKLRFDKNVAEKYKIHFLQSVDTDKGLAVAVGTDGEDLWFWVENDKGVSYWHDIQGDIRNYPKIQPIALAPLPKLFQEFIEKNYGLGVLEKLRINLKTNAIEEDNNLAVNLKQEFLSHPQLFADQLFKLLSMLQENVSQLKYDMMISNLLTGLTEDHTGIIAEKKRIEEKISQALKLSELARDFVDTDMMNTALSPVNHVLDNLKLQLNALNSILDAKKKIVTIGTTFSTSQIQNYEHAEKIINYLINLILDIEIDFSDISAENLNTYDSIYGRIGEFIFQNADSDADKQDVAQNALVYFVLCSTTSTDIETLKKSCYLQLLGEKNLPSMYDPETYCEKYPEKFIVMAKKVIELLTERTTLAKNHKNLEFEIVKLSHYLSLAYKKNQQKDEAEKSIAAVISRLLSLMRNNPGEEEILVFAQKHSSSNPALCISLANNYHRMENYLSSNKFLEQAKRLLVQVSYHHEDSNFIEYVYLLSQSEDQSHQAEAKKLLKGCFLKTDDNKPSVLDFSWANTDMKMQTVLRDTYWELAEQTKEEKYYKFTLNSIQLLFDMKQQSSHDCYLRYLCQTRLQHDDNFRDLTTAAEKGHAEALRLLESLNDPFARSQVATIYRCGNELLRDTQKAVEYFQLADTDEANLQIAEMIINNEIKGSELNPINLLSNIVTSQEKYLPFEPGDTSGNTCKLGALALLEKCLKHEKYRAQALLPLAKVEHFKLCKPQVNDKEAAEYYDEYFQSNPEKYESLIPAVTSELIFFLNSKTILGVLSCLHESGQKSILTVEDFKLLANLLCRRQEEDLYQLWVSYSEVFSYLDQKLVTILDRIKPHIKPKDLQKIITDEIAHGKQQQVLLQWLTNNTDIVGCMLYDMSSLAKLKDITEWQTFLKQAKIQKLHSSMFLQQTIDSSKISKLFLPTFFRKSSGAEEILKSVQTLYIEKKTEIWTHVVNRKKELAGNPESSEFKFYLKLIDELNAVESLEQLDNLILDLQKHDSAFNKNMTPTKRSHLEEKKDTQTVREVKLAIV